MVVVPANVYPSLLQNAHLLAVARNAWRADIATSSLAQARRDAEGLRQSFKHAAQVLAKVAASERLEDASSHKREHGSTRLSKGKNERKCAEQSVQSIRSLRAFGCHELAVHAL